MNHEWRSNIIWTSMLLTLMLSQHGCFLSRRAEKLTPTQQYQQLSDAFNSALDSVTLLMETGKLTDIKTVDRVNAIRLQMNGLLNLMHEKAACLLYL